MGKWKVQNGPASPFIFQIKLTSAAGHDPFITLEFAVIMQAMRMPFGSSDPANVRRHLSSSTQAYFGAAIQDSNQNRKQARAIYVKR
jgi:hypothetical protein